MSAAHTRFREGRLWFAWSIVFAAQKVWVDLVLGMPLAGVPLRPDCPQPELPHQPPDAPAANRNPLSQERHLEPTAAVDGMVGENPVEPLQKLEFLGRFRPRPVVEAAARNPEQRALPDYGQPRLRRDHRPPLSTREMAGCPARKSHSTCSCPIFRCRSSITFCASSAAGALLPRANSSVARPSEGSEVHRALPLVLSRGLSRHTTASTPSGGMPGRAGGVAPGGRTASHRVRRPERAKT